LDPKSDLLSSLCADFGAGTISERGGVLGAMELGYQRLEAFQERNAKQAPKMLQRLQRAVIENKNVFEVLMDAVRVCSLGQITNALFEVGGQYRRNM
jgi:methylmalonyl-CoA mutase N-terminal domain/subunit